MNVEKDVTLKEFVEERIEKNEDLFTKNEQETILRNKNLVKKIYILGVYDSKCVYNKISNCYTDKKLSREKVGKIKK